jgi:hypothetical protein
MMPPLSFFGSWPTFHYEKFEIKKPWKIVQWISKYPPLNVFKWQVATFAWTHLPPYLYWFDSSFSRLQYIFYKMFFQEFCRDLIAPTNGIMFFFYFTIFIMSNYWLTLPNMVFSWAQYLYAFLKTSNLALRRISLRPE